MGRLLGFGNMLDRFCLSPVGSPSCFCASIAEDEENMEGKLLKNDFRSQKVMDISSPQTLAFHLKPKTVILKVSMHCNGCARRVEKYISKLEGVSSCKVDLQTKMVIVKGDIFPQEILQSVCKVKNAQLLETPLQWKEEDEKKDREGDSLLKLES